MSKTTTAAYSNYSFSKAPKAYDAAFFNVEFQKIQRAFLPTTVRYVVADTDVLVTDRVLLVNAQNGAVTVSLQPVQRADGLFVSIVKIDASGNAVTIGGVVSGVGNPTLAAQYDSMTVVCNANADIQYFKIAEI